MQKKFLVAITLILSVLIAKEVSAFSFSISLNPQQGTVGKEGTLKAAINIYSASSDWEDNWENVSLFSAVEPAGTRISFSPSYCRPPCSSIMTITTYKEAEIRNYSIPVIATGAGETRTATYYLSIASPYSYIQQDLINKLQAQIAAIKAEILRLQQELAQLISSGLLQK